jgi:hypothetical protein
VTLDDNPNQIAETIKQEPDIVPKLIANHPELAEMIADEPALAH